MVTATYVACKGLPRRMSNGLGTSGHRSVAPVPYEGHGRGSVAGRRGRRTVASGADVRRSTVAGVARVLTTPTPGRPRPAGMAWRDRGRASDETFVRR